MKRLLPLLAACLLLTACGTQLKVAQVDPATGQLRSEKGTVGKATVLIAKPISLAPFKSMAFVSGAGDYGVDQLRAVKYFDEVLNYNDLQKLVIAKNLQEQVPSLNEPIGLNKLARAHKPFLWIAFKGVQKENKPYLQLVATNPLNMEEVFASEVYLDLMWSGVNDQNSRYPLFNSLIEWLNQNR